MGQFTKATAITVAARILNLIFGIGTSVILARLLGPEGKGIYTLAMLLPSLIVIFANLGIGPATVYYVAKGRYPRQEILGNNITFGLGIGSVAVFFGLLIALFFQKSVFHGVAQVYLLLALLLIPGDLLYAYLRHILLGCQSFKEYNIIDIIRSLLKLFVILIAVWVLKAGVGGALLAVAIAWFLSDVILFFLTRKIAGGVSFRLNFVYIREAAFYGLQTYLGSILTFLNYRIDIFLVNVFLNPVSVGFYSVGVLMVEKLWLVSLSAGLVLFPMSAAETTEQKRKELTPLVARTVLLLTAIGALLFFLLANLIVQFLYSDTFLPAVLPMQILLVGIVAISMSRVLAYDIAGRGRPILNTYVSAGTIVINIVLNLIWIPRYGIVGAASASSVSYGISLFAQLFVYCRVCGNSWANVLLPQRSDWLSYRLIGVNAAQWAKNKVREFLSV